MNITVYLGASRQFPALEQAVRALGAWIGESGNSLVYGGSKSGLMGVLAESTHCMQAAASPASNRSFFIDAELQYDAIDELIVTETMAERRTKNDRTRRCVHRDARRYGYARGDFRGDEHACAGSSRRPPAFCTI